MCVTDGRLLVAGRDAEALARQHGTPLYAFDLTRIEEVCAHCRARCPERASPTSCGSPSRRCAPPRRSAACARLAGPGDPAAVGIDACSPGEVLHVLDQGWRPEEISFTGTNLSERDLDVLVPLDVHINVDLLTQLERVGRHMPGGSVGLRVNPRAGVMRGGESLYAGARPTKFGIYEEDLDEALAIAASSRAHDRHRPHAPRQQHADRRAARLRGGASAGLRPWPVPHRRRLPDRRGERRRRAGHAAARGRGAARPRRLRGRPRPPLRPPRRRPSGSSRASF